MASEFSSIGLLMAAVTSVSNVFKDVAGKKVLDRHEVIATTFWWRLVVAFVLMIAFLGQILVFGELPVIRDAGPLFGINALHFSPVVTFLIYLLLDGIGVGIAVTLYFRALQISPISLCLPFLAFTPIFLIPTGYFLLGELPPWIKLAGVLLVVAGSIVMHRELFSISFFEPFRAIIRERGSRYMLIVAFIFSITNPLDKILVTMSDALTQSVSYAVALLIFFTGFAIAKKSDLRKVVKSMPGWIVLAGILDAIALLMQFISHNYIDVVITISVKRAGIILAVLMGWLIFKERGITDKLIASSVMLAGVLIIYLPLTVMQTFIFVGLTLIGMIAALYLTKPSKKIGEINDLSLKTEASSEGEAVSLPGTRKKNISLNID
jgi:uncharacterized membrane protein